MSSLSSRRVFLWICLACIVFTTTRTWGPLQSFVLLTSTSSATSNPIVDPRQKLQVRINASVSRSTDDGRSHPKHNLQCHPIDFADVARRRQLVHPEAADLLRRMVQHPTRFQPLQDLFVFEHIIKTGGTSFSSQLEDIFGAEAVLPGSRPSGFFQKNELTDMVESLRNDNQKDSTGVNLVDTWWTTQQVVFSHSYLYQSPTDASFAEWFLAQIPTDPSTGRPRKRVVMGTLYRHPLEWLASNFSEWLCRLRGRMEEAWDGVYAPDAPRPGKSPVDSPTCWGMNNLTMLADYWLQHTLPRKCRDGSMENQRMCKQWKRSGQDPMPQCRSVAGFAESVIFQNQLRDNPPYLLQKDNGNDMDNELDKEAIAEVEERTMKRFGGLQEDDDNRIPFVWLGLTERYNESLLLFYDWMGRPLDEKFVNTPRMRYKPCRPISFWSEKDQLLLSRIVWRSFVVHKVANAILDVRVADWCCRKAQERQDGSLSAIETNVVQQFCDATIMDQASS